MNEDRGGRRKGMQKKEKRRRRERSKGGDRTGREWFETIDKGQHRKRECGKGTSSKRAEGDIVREREQTTRRKGERESTDLDPTASINHENV